MVNCTVCKSGDVRRLFVKDGFVYWKCARCMLIMINPPPSHEYIKKVYDKNYYREGRLDERGKKDTVNVKTLTFAHWLDKIERYHPPGRILDIGCATGLFLGIARERGWNPYGVELSEYSSGIAREKFGSRIITGSFKNMQLEPESFDVVTMFDLIEHMLSPMDLLYDVHRILKQRGVIAISTVDTGSLLCRLMGSRWPHFNPEHLNYFCAANLTASLKESGFDVLEKSKINKFLSIAYIKSSFELYHPPVLGGISRLLYRITPRRLASRPIRIPSGEMLMLARKM